MSRDQDLENLDECRRRIDVLDRKILGLLNERTEIVEEIGRIKRRLAMPIYEPKREDEVYENVAGHNIGPLPVDAVHLVFERIIDEMRTVQKMRMLEEAASAAPLSRWEQAGPGGPQAGEEHSGSPEEQRRAADPPKE